MLQTDAERIAEIRAMAHAMSVADAENIWQAWLAEQRAADDAHDRDFQRGRGRLFPDFWADRDNRQTAAAVKLGHMRLDD